MVGTTGRWSVLITVICWGRFCASNTAATPCRKPGYASLCTQLFAPPAVPEDAILVALHSHVNLTCAGCEGRVSWSRQSPHDTPRSLVESGHLVLSSVTYEDEDNYTCYKDGAPVCSVQLMVRDEQQENARLSCYHRYPTHNITCEWKPRGQLHPSSSVTLIKAIVLMPPDFYPCRYNSTSEMFTCSSPYNEGDSTKHIFYLCVSGRTNSQQSGNLEAYVKDLLHIGPPINVRVTPVEKHARRLRVSWSRPAFWQSGFYGLRYQVLYRVEDSPHPSNGTTSETAFIIHDAVMGRKHLVRVRAREEFQEKWGSWSEAVMGVPWSDGDTTPCVSVRCGGDGKSPDTKDNTFMQNVTEKGLSEYDTPTNQDPTNEDDVFSGLTPRFPWIAPCVAFGLVLFLFFGLWIRYQEIKIIKLQWGFLRSLFQPSSKVNTTQPPASESPLIPSPSSVAVTVPPMLYGE